MSPRPGSGAAAIGMLATVLLATACSAGPSPAATADSANVIVAVGAENQYANVIEQVGGAYVKVTAIDPKTGTEASIVGPASAPRSVLESNAAKKLLYVLKKQRGEA